MSIQPSQRRLQLLLELEEEDAEIDIGLAQLLQQTRRRRRGAPKRFWVRPWIKRRKDFGHYDRLMHELEVEDHEAFTNFLRVPPFPFFGAMLIILKAICIMRCCVLEFRMGTV